MPGANVPSSELFGLPGEVVAGTNDVTQCHPKARLNPFDMNLCGVLFVEMDEAANILMK